MYPCGHPRTEANTYRKLVAGRTPGSKPSLCAYCKTCDNERTRRYRERNPGYNARYLRAWRLGLRRLPGCRLERVWR